MRTKMKVLVLMLAIGVMLVGCQKPNADESEPEVTPPSQTGIGDGFVNTRPQETVLKMSVEGGDEDVPAVLFMSDFYSVYIPVDGWERTESSDDNMLIEKWTSTNNPDVNMSVSHYDDYSVEGAFDLFTASHAYNFNYTGEEMSGTGVNTAIVGVDDEGNSCFFFATGSEGTMMVVSWEYPQGAEEGYGVRLPVIAKTIEMK